MTGLFWKERNLNQPRTVLTGSLSNAYQSFSFIKVPEGITISERFGDKLKAKIKPLHIFIIQCKCIKKASASYMYVYQALKAFFSIDSALNDLKPQSHG